MNTRHLVLWLLSALCGGAVLLYLLTGVEWNSLLALPARDVALLAGSTALLIVLQSMGAAELLRGLGCRIDVIRVLGAILAGSAVAVAGDPRLGVPARIWFYKALAGVSYRIGTAQVALETVIWLLLMTCVLLVPGEFGARYGGALALVAGAAITLALGALYRGPELLARVWLIGKYFRPGTRHADFVRQVRDGIVAVDRLRLGLGVLWFGATYVVDAWSLMLLTNVLGSELSFMTAAHVIVVSYLVGVASLLPLGLGARDITFALLLELAGVPAGSAGLAALIHRTLRTLLPLLAGALTLLLVRRHLARSSVQPTGSAP